MPLPDPSVPDVVLAHIAEVGAGRCTITEESIAAEPDPVVAEILAGLLMLHEDLQLAARRRDELTHERELLVNYQKRLLDELRAAVRARDEFLTVASHELRTPLTTLGLQVSTLERLARSRGAEELLPSLEVVDRQVHRLERLIDGLLDVGRLTAGRVETRAEEVDLTELVRSVAGRLSEELRHSGSELTIEAAGPVRGKWDPFLLERIIGNLIGNAIRYGRGRPVVVSVQAVPSGTRLSVSDQGIGIPLDKQARIFEPFERAVSPQHYGGLGLGLWVARKFAQEIGGNIRVQSAVGKGSTFTLELP